MASLKSELLQNKDFESLEQETYLNLQRTVGILNGPFLQLFKQNDHVRSQDLALFVYEQSPCMNCRYSAVKFLCDWGNAPSWLLDEGQHDASEEVRELCGAQGTKS